MASLTRPFATPRSRLQHRPLGPDRRDARPLRQAGAAIRSRQRLLLRGLRRAPSGRISAVWRCQPSWAARDCRSPASRSSSGASAITRHRPRWRSTCTSTGPATPPTCGGPATPRNAGCSRRRRRARCSPPGTPRAATTFRCCSRRPRPSGSKAATGSPAASRSAACHRYGRTSGIHGMDTADPAKPKIVHAFMPRDTEGYRIDQTWDVMGMRATRSDDTVLDGVFVPDRYVVRVVPAGAAGIDAFVLGLFAWALLGFGNIYFGLARRALDMTLEAVKSKRSIGLSRPMAYHAELQHRIAQMGLAFESIGPHLDRVADDWSNGVDARRRLAGQALRREVPRGRGLLAHRRSGARSRRRVRDLPAAAASNNSSATHAWAASTRPIPC